jgi:CheY-like chemotaxis protein
MLVKTILERCGYKVLLAENGREAVEVFRQHVELITAILLDLTMPVMGGEEAFHLIRAIREDVPIVVSTGYDEGGSRKLLGSRRTGFLKKPYKVAQLCESIRMKPESLTPCGPSTPPFPG